MISSILRTRKWDNQLYFLSVCGSSKNGTNSARKQIDISSSCYLLPDRLEVLETKHDTSDVCGVLCCVGLFGGNDVYCR